MVLKSKQSFRLIFVTIIVKYCGFHIQSTENFNQKNESLIKLNQIS